MNLNIETVEAGITGRPSLVLHSDHGCGIHPVVTLKPGKGLLDPSDVSGMRTLASHFHRKAATISDSFSACCYLPAQRRRQSLTPEM